MNKNYRNHLFLYLEATKRTMFGRKKIDLAMH